MGDVGGRGGSQDDGMDGQQGKVEGGKSDHLRSYILYISQTSGNHRDLGHHRRQL